MRSFLPVGLLAAGALGACGGGGGGGSSTPPPPPPPPPQAQFSVAPATLTFNAAEPKSAVPAAGQVTGTVTGTLTGTTLYILVNVTGTNVIDAVSAPVISGNSGAVLVTPVAPMSLGTGTFTGTLTVRACMDSPTCASGELAGSPRTVNVNYSVGSSVQQDTVMPRVVDGMASGAVAVVLRGSGLSGVTSVHFGAFSSGTVTVRSATEVAVQLPPALPAGTHAVSLNNGTVPFTGSIVAVAPSAFAAATLGYPDVPLDVPGLVYDAERRALFVAMRYANRTERLNQLDHRIRRYAFDGTNWTAPTVSPTLPHHVTAQLRDLVLGPRGDRLLVMSEADVKEVDPVTLDFISPGQGVNNGLIGMSEYMRFIAFMNDGHALISSDSTGGGGGGTPVLYSLATRTFTNINFRAGSTLGGTSTHIGGIVGRGAVAASGDGSRALLVAGNSHLRYDSATGQIGRATGLGFIHSNDYRPAIDNTGAHIVLGNGISTGVYAGDYTVLCTLPADTRAYTISPAGNRAFTLSSTSKLQAYLTANASGGPCSPDGPEIDIDDPGIDPSALSSVQMTISPDGATIFMAGVNHIVVQPWPPGP